MKKGPYIFIGILILALIFIIGVQYGKRVNTTNETMKILLTIIPTPTLSPAIKTSPIAFKVFESKSCGISFIYPAELQPITESSYSGTIEKESETAKITFDCDPNLDTFIPEDPKSATTSVQIGSETSTGYKSAEENTITTQFRHPQRSTPIQITFTTSLQPLIEKTFVFMK